MCEKVCIVIMKEINPEISIDFIHFQPSWLQKCFLNAVCMYGWMDVYLARTWANGQKLFIFVIKDFVHARSVPCESGHSNSKNKHSSDGPQIAKWLFSWKWFYSCNIDVPLYVQCLCVVYFLSKPILTGIWNHKLEKLLLKMTNGILFIQRINLQCKEYCIFKIINYGNCNVIAGLNELYNSKEEKGIID